MPGMVLMYSIRGEIFPGPEEVVVVVWVSYVVGMSVMMTGFQGNA
jgi:hypothetical protein